MDIFSYKEKIDAYLSEYFDALLRNSDGIEKVVIKNLMDFTIRGGKRLRPLFMILGYWLNSDEIDERIIRASSSLEFIQSYLLIHDDVIDESEMRRGGPSYHRMFTYSKKMSHDLAIVGGDVANSLAYEILLSSGFPSENVRKSAIYMTQILKYTGLGQALDIALPLKEQKTIQDIDRVHEMKTAHYTINGPLKMGASLSNFPNIEDIDLYGIPLGKAFQIQDDILGLFGDEKTLGKPVTSDLEEGKITHLILYALEMGDESQKEIIRKIHGKKGITSSELEQIRKVIRESGAYEKTVELMLGYLDSAVRSIPKIAKDNERREQLEKIAYYMVKRNY